MHGNVKHFTINISAFTTSCTATDVTNRIVKFHKLHTSFEKKARSALATCKVLNLSSSHHREGRWGTKMISQPVSSIFPCSPLPSGTWRTPVLSIPWCFLPTFSSVCLVFSPLSLCLARWFWPDLMNGRHDHTTAVCVFSRWSGGLRGVRLPAGSWHGLPRFSCLVERNWRAVRFRTRHGREETIWKLVVLILTSSELTLDNKVWSFFREREIVYKYLQGASVDPVWLPVIPQ